MKQRRSRVVGRFVDLNLDGLADVGVHVEAWANPAQARTVRSRTNASAKYDFSAPTSSAAILYLAYSAGRPSSNSNVNPPLIAISAPIAAYCPLVAVDAMTNTGHLRCVTMSGPHSTPA